MASLSVPIQVELRDNGEIEYIIVLVLVIGVNKVYFCLKKKGWISIADQTIEKYKITFYTWKVFSLFFYNKL